VVHLRRKRDDDVQRPMPDEHGRPQHTGRSSSVEHSGVGVAGGAIGHDVYPYPCA